MAKVLGLLVVVVALLGGCAMSSYNGLVSQDESVDAAWTEVNNQYKRRFDLIPQLVETVKAAANFEKSTITEVTEARASVGRLSLPEGPVDQAQLDQYMRAQDALGQSLSRLLVVAENYPDLKSSQNFLSLQDQVEGTENRIGGLAVTTSSPSDRSTPRCGRSRPTCWPGCSVSSDDLR